MTANDVQILVSMLNGVAMTLSIIAVVLAVMAMKD